MALSIHEVLFRLTGDEDDARKSLQTITAELEAFAAIEAEAEADLDTRGALLRIRELEGALNDLDDRTANPKIEADIAGVMAQLVTLQAELEALDDEDVVIDVDVRRDKLAQIATLTRQITLLSRASASATGDFKSFGQRIADTAVNFGPFTTQVRTAVPLTGALAGVVVALGAGIALLVTHLAAAVAGLASFAIALGGVFSAGIFAAVVAVQRFQQQSEKAGTPAHALLKAWQSVTDVIKALGPLVDPIFTALAEVVRSFAGLLRSLGPALASFARDAARSLGPLTELLSDPAFRTAIQQIVVLAGDALRPMVRIGTALFRIFTNIARAALPFLIDGLRTVARLFESWADASDNATRLSAVMAVLAAHVSLFFSLLSQVGRLFLGFFVASEPAARAFVGWLRDGIQAMADWVNSAEGQERIKQFFEDVVPLLEQVIEAIAKIVLFFIELGQLAAPILTPIIAAFNAVLDAVNFILEKLNALSPVLRQVIGVIGLILAPLGKVRLVVAAVVAVFGFLPRAATQAFNAIKRIAGTVGAFLQDLFRKVGAVASVMFKALPRIVSAIWNRVKAIIVGIATTIRDGVVGAWRAILTFNRTIWNGIAALITTAFTRVRDFVLRIANGIKGLITGAWNAIKRATSTAFAFVYNAIVGAFEAVFDFVTSIPAKMFQLGRDIVTGIADGIKSLPGIIGDALEDVVMSPVNALKGLLGIGSPSKLTMAYGEEVGRGFSIGIQKMLRTVSRSARAMAAAGIPNLASGGALGAAGAARAAGGASTTTSNKFEIPVTVAGGTGVPDHRAFVAGIDRELRQRGLSIA